jgi:SAM-dependent methyltransferase
MNPQENHWRGPEGNAYQDRNQVDWTLRVPFWRHILDVTQARTVLDVGCACGWNQRAIQEVDKDIWTVGVDVNEYALEKARNDGFFVVNQKAMNVGDSRNSKVDLAVTSGVLIHVPEDEIARTMWSIAQAATRFVLAIEYASESGDTESIVYRGEPELLWRRDWRRLYEALGLRLVEMGFADGYDRCTYYLMSKS